MEFLSEKPDFAFTSPLFAGILANTLLSTVPGVSGAGPGPEKTLLTPNLDAELITNGVITSHPFSPNTPTGCPTPATITRAMMVLTGLKPLFINAGLRHTPVIPCLDAYGEVAGDPRNGDALPGAARLFSQGERMGFFLSGCCDLLVLGECVPGGTTTALCLLRALGYDASVSSSFADNPVTIKEEICRRVLERVEAGSSQDPLDLVRSLGDPMMPVAAGIAKTYTGTLVFAGGTQMLAVSALIKALGQPLHPVVTTSYVRDDPTANVQALAGKIGVRVTYVDPGFQDLGHAGLARYCIGEVKEGMGAGGAMYLANLMGYAPDRIREAILSAVSASA
ncbi:MAG TPA: TIGR00303 family protein [Methanoregula sp.]|nr:TIGR00303 family protein [Methanoregula sp.]